MFLVSGFKGPTLLTAPTLPNAPQSLASQREDFVQRFKRLPEPVSKCQGLLLDLTKRNFCKGVPNRGLFAVYEGLPEPFISARLLFVTRSMRELSVRLRDLRKKGEFSTGYVYVQTAVSKADLTDLRHEYTIRRVLADIEKIKKAGTDKQTRLLIRRALEREGLTPGPRREDHAAWKIATLCNLSKGMRFEGALNATGVSLALESSRQGVWKYCREFYRWCKIMGLHTPEDWQRSRGDVSLLRLRFGLELPRDRDAVVEAYRRGKKTFENRLSKAAPQSSGTLHFK